MICKSKTEGVQPVGDGVCSAQDTVRQNAIASVRKKGNIVLFHLPFNHYK